MERNVMWSAWSETGLEHLRLVQEDETILADGMILKVQDGNPLRAHYRIRCDSEWRVNDVDVNLLDGDGQNIKLHADGKGHWTDGSDNPIRSLDGCIDVDISITAFTNTLPIRRMGLKQGESSDLNVAYVAVPEMTVKSANQRYTCLELSSDSGLYKYEGLFRKFTADLAIDSDGLVHDYPELVRRVWSR